MRNLKATFYYDAKTKDLKWVVSDEKPLVYEVLGGFSEKEFVDIDFAIKGCTDSID
jgi:hypothetical protein